MAAKTSEWRPGPTVCRCCLAEGCYKDISTEYFWMGKREVYAEMLSDTLNVSIAYSQSGGPNSNSRLICEPCISRLRDASDFRRQVLECEKTFMNHLDPGSSSVQKEVQLSLEEVKIERVKQEKKGVSDDEDFDDRVDFIVDNDDDDDDLDDEPLMKLATKVPKKEVDLLDLLDSTQITVKRKSTAKTKAPPAKKAKSLPTVKPSASKPSASAPKAEKKKKGSDTIPDSAQPNRRIVPLFQVAYDRSLCKPLGTIRDFSKLGNKGSKKTKGFSAALETITFVVSRSPSPLLPVRSPSPFTVEDINPPAEFLLKPEPKKKCSDSRQNALTIFEFSTAYPFIFSNNKFKCFVCSQPYLDLIVLKQHMQEHAFAPLKRLVNNRKENVLKVDVSDLACKLCSLPIRDLITLKRHLKESHNKPVDTELQDNLIPFNLNLVNEGYQCVICEQNFIKIRILVIHMSAHFSNYSCEICGSGFMTLRLLKKHLEVHETGSFPCDRCDKSFSTSYKRALHVRGVHLKQYPRRCPMCPERFNSNYKRTIHLQDVHNQSTRVHKCKTCGRGFNLKYHLICHIRSVHLQERNQQCDVCHQRFCNKESLKRHMVIHTGEKNHKCEVCGMAFLRRKNLKDHLRLHDIN